MKQIPLTRGMFALVDDADFESVNQFKWCVQKSKKSFYAVRAVRRSDGKKSLQYLHRFLISIKSRLDHRDGDGLNNQRHNLRPATCAQNGANRKKTSGGTSAFKGVHWTAANKPWQSRIQINGEREHLGNFESEQDAARAYDIAAKEKFGEFAKLNFPERQ